MTLYGLMMVRNEVDLLRANLAFHLAAGVDAFLVVDNGSTDGTTELLDQLAADPRVARTRWDGPYRQSEVTTALAREAYLRGADWVVAIDADEFWWTPGGNLAAALRAIDAGAIAVRVVNFVQRRQQTESAADALLNMTRRAPSTSGDWEGDQARVARGEIGFVEATYPPKWICRATPTLWISMGNHEIRGESGAKVESEAIVCLHAPLRSRAALRAKIVDHGARARALGLEGDLWWQALRWSTLDADGDLAAEWRASSYDREALDVAGAAHAVIEDGRLRQSVEPWLDRAAPWPASPATPAIVHPAFRLVEEGGRLDVEIAGEPRSAELAPWRARLDRCAAAIELLRRQSADRSSQIEARLGDVEYLRAELRQREEGLAYLRSELRQREEAIADQRAELLQREEGIAYLRSELRQRGEAIAYLHSELAERDQQIEALGRQLARRDEELERAAANEAGWKESVDRLVSEIEALRASASWRLTGPLRALARGGKRTDKGTEKGS